MTRPKAVEVLRDASGVLRKLDADLGAIGIRRVRQVVEDTARLSGHVLLVSRALERYYDPDSPGTTDERVRALCLAVRRMLDVSERDEVPDEG